MDDENRRMKVKTILSCQCRKLRLLLQYDIRIEQFDSLNDQHNSFSSTFRTS